MDDVMKEVDAEMRRQLNDFGARVGPAVQDVSQMYEQARAMAEKHGTKEAARMAVTSALRPKVAMVVDKALGGDLGGALSILKGLVGAGDSPDES